MKGIIQSKNIICTECGNLLYIDYTMRLLSNPPQHRVRCRECGKNISMTLKEIKSREEE